MSKKAEAVMKKLAKENKKEKSNFLKDLGGQIRSNANQEKNLKELLFGTEKEKAMGKAWRKGLFSGELPGSGLAGGLVTGTKAAVERGKKWDKKHRKKSN